MPRPIQQIFKSSTAQAQGKTKRPLSEIFAQPEAEAQPTGTLLEQEANRLGTVPYGQRKQPADTPLSLDLALGFTGNQEDKVNLLRKRFKYVTPMPDGNFLLGDTLDSMKPLSAEGLFTDAVSKLARGAGDLPALGLTTLGVALAPESLGASMALAGAGMGTGEASRQLLGKLIGVNTSTAGEIGEDAMVSALFGAGTQGLFMGLSGPVKSMMPKAGKALKIVQDSKVMEPTALGRGMGKIGYALTADPIVPAAWETSSKYGFSNFSDEFVNPSKAIELSHKLNAGFKETRKALGARVNAADVKLAQLTGEEAVVDIATPARELQKRMIDRGILLESAGRLEGPGGLPFITKDLMSPASTLEKADLPVLGRIADRINDLLLTSRNKSGQVPVKQAITLKRVINENFDSLGPTAQNTIQPYVDSLLKSLTQIAQKAEFPEFAQAYQTFGNFMSARTRLAEAGFNTYNPTHLARLATHYINLGTTGDTAIAKQSASTVLGHMKQYGKMDLLSEIEKFSSAQVLAGKDPSLFRTNIVAGLASAGTIGRLLTFGISGIQRSTIKVGRLLQGTRSQGQGRAAKFLGDLIKKTEPAREVGSKLVTPTVAVGAEKKFEQKSQK